MWIDPLISIYILRHFFTPSKSHYYNIDWKSVPHFAADDARISCSSQGVIACEIPHLADWRENMRTCHSAIEPDRLLVTFWVAQTSCQMSMDIISRSWSWNQTLIDHFLIDKHLILTVLSIPILPTWPIGIVLFSAFLRQNCWIPNLMRSFYQLAGMVIKRNLDCTILHCFCLGIQSVRHLWVVEDLAHKRYRSTNPWKVQQLPLSRSCLLLTCYLLLAEPLKWTSAVILRTSSSHLPQEYPLPPDRSRHPFNKHEMSHLQRLPRCRTVRAPHPLVSSLVTTTLLSQVITAVVIRRFPLVVIPAVPDQTPTSQCLCPPPPAVLMSRCLKRKHLSSRPDLVQCRWRSPQITTSLSSVRPFWALQDAVWSWPTSSITSYRNSPTTARPQPRGRLPSDTICLSTTVSSRTARQTAVVATTGASIVPVWTPSSRATSVGATLADWYSSWRKPKLLPWNLQIQLTATGHLPPSAMLWPPSIFTET